MEAIGQLVSGVAHELNNPLAAIVAFSQLIFRDERLPADLRDDAGLLVQEADRTRRIVQNLLDFARQRPPERLPTAIPSLVESVLALQSYSISAGRIAIDLDLPDDLPEIDADRGQLQQVLLNLTLNAIQAIRSNQKIRSHPGSAPTRSSVRRASRRSGCRLADDGSGIPVHLRSRLFLPFFDEGAGPGHGPGPVGVVRDRGRAPGQPPVRTRERGPDSRGRRRTRERRSSWSCRAYADEAASTAPAPRTDSDEIPGHRSRASDGRCTRPAAALVRAAPARLPANGPRRAPNRLAAAVPQRRPRTSPRSSS